MQYLTGPQSLWMVRHGQSEGNVARDLADSQGLEVIDLSVRDADAPLSENGEAQADALGRWLGRQPADELPDVVVSSPYVRAFTTAQRILAAAGPPLSDVLITLDERLRDRESGILDRLTWHGTSVRFPEESERARRVGRYYYRMPGGESWADMTLRLRSALADFAREYADKRVLVVAHDIPIQLIVSVIDGLTEQETIDLVAKNYANCGLTRYDLPGSDADPDAGYVQRAYNFTAPVEQSAAPVTAAPDVPEGPR